MAARVNNVAVFTEIIENVVFGVALWYFGGLLWRLRRGAAGVKPVDDLVDWPGALAWATGDLG